MTRRRGIVQKRLACCDWRLSNGRTLGTLKRNRSPSAGVVERG